MDPRVCVFPHTGEGNHLRDYELTVLAKYGDAEDAGDAGGEHFPLLLLEMLRL
jgi:hypothetical protein